MKYKENVPFMPFVDNKGVKIYYQVEGKGSPIILITGFAGSINFWYKYSYVDSLKQKNQLILIDKRGHRKSSKPHNRISGRPLLITKNSDFYANK